MTFRLILIGRTDNSYNFQVYCGLQTVNYSRLRSLAYYFLFIIIIIVVGVGQNAEGLPAQLLKGIAAGFKLVIVFPALGNRLLCAFKIFLKLRDIAQTERIQRIVGHLVFIVDDKDYLVLILRQMSVQNVIAVFDVLFVAHKLGPYA